MQGTTVFQLLSTVKDARMDIGQRKRPQKAHHDKGHLVFIQRTLAVGGMITIHMDSSLIRLDLVKKEDTLLLYVHSKAV